MSDSADMTTLSAHPVTFKVVTLPSRDGTNIPSHGVETTWTEHGGTRIYSTVADASVSLLMAGGQPILDALSTTGAPVTEFTVVPHQSAAYLAVETDLQPSSSGAESGKDDGQGSENTGTVRRRRNPIGTPPVYVFRVDRLKGFALPEEATEVSGIPGLVQICSANASRVFIGKFGRKPTRSVLQYPGESSIDVVMSRDKVTCSEGHVKVFNPRPRVPEKVLWGPKLPQEPTRGRVVGEVDEEVDDE